MPPTFLLRDDFTTAQSAPLVSPRDAEPGPGTLTLVDTGNNLSISSGALQFSTTQITPGLSVSGASAPTAIGLGAFFLFTPAGTSRFLFLGVSNAPGAVSQGLYLRDTGEIRAAFINASQINNVGTFTTGEQAVATIMRSAGTLMVYRNTSGVWSLLWVDNVYTAANVYPIANPSTSATVSAMALSALRALQLPAPFNSNYGLATTRLAGARAAGDTFVHEANCVLEWTETTRPSALNTDFRFRRQDASNYWQVTIDSTGALTLNEVVAGTPTQRGTAAAVVTSGHRIVIVADGTTIRGYSNNVLRWTYATATNFQTATAGELTALGTTGAVSDVVSWPRQITGVPASILDAAVGGSGDLTATLAAATLTATGQGLTGQLTQTLAAATLVSTGQLPIAGQLAATLAAATLTAAGRLPAITAQMTAQLGAVLLASAGRLSIRGQLSITLGAATLYASNHPIAIELGTVYGQGGSGFVFGQLDYGEVIGI